MGLSEGLYNFPAALPNIPTWITIKSANVGKSNASDKIISAVEYEEELVSYGSSEQGL